MSIMKFSLVNNMMSIYALFLVLCAHHNVGEKVINFSNLHEIQESHWCMFFQSHRVFSKNKWNSCNHSSTEKHKWPPQASRIVRIAVSNEKSHGDCWAYNKNGNIILAENYGSFILRILQDILQFRLKGVIANVNATVGKADAMRDLVANEKADLSICHLRVIPSRMKDAYFLHSTLTTTQALIFTASHLPLIEDVFVLTFSGTLWLCFLLAIILLIVCFRFSTWLHSFIRPDHEPWSWIEVMLWAVAAVCQQSYNRHPKGLSCRTTFIIGYLITYLLYTGFAAGVTSLLAVQGRDIELSLDEVVAMKLTLVYTPRTAAEFKLSQLSESTARVNFGRVEKIVKTKMVESNKDLFENLDHDNIVGVGDTIEFQKYIRDKLYKTSRNKYTVSEIAQSKTFEAMIVSKNSPLKEIFNFWLLRFHETGLLDLGRRRYIDIQSENCCELPGWSSADLGNVLSALLILTTGYFFSVLILFFEMAWMRKKTGTKWESKTKQDILRQYNRYH